MTRFMLLEEARHINAQVLGGQARVLNSGLLESALMRPQSSVFGEDAYPTLLEKAAALLHSLVKNHAFVDGNKRTAVVATIYFLEVNGFSPRWEPAAALAFILQVAQGQLQIPAIAAWLAEHSQAH